MIAIDRYSLSSFIEEKRKKIGFNSAIGMNYATKHLFLLITVLSYIRDQLVAVSKSNLKMLFSW